MGSDDNTESIPPKFIIFLYIKWWVEELILHSSKNIFLIVYIHEFVHHRHIGITRNSDYVEHKFYFLVMFG